MPFLLGIGESCQGLKKFFAEIPGFDVRITQIPVTLHDLLRFSLAHEPVVHVESKPPIRSQGLIEEGEGDGRIDPAAEKHQDLP